MNEDRLGQQLAQELAVLKETGLLRQRRCLESPCAASVTVDGQKRLNFASNNYLGLADHPAIVQAMAEGAARWGAGSGASHLVSGHFAPQEALERALAQFVGFPRALSVSTGYLANLAIVPTLADRHSAIFADKLNHASLIDAVQLAKANGAQSHRYPHNDTAALARLLAQSQARTKLIVTDAVFSMDGDLAPLAALFDLAEAHDAWLIIDDAHGFGVLGPQGRGTLAHCGLSYHPRLLLMATLGKAAGVAGAFIAGSETAIDYLLNKARSTIFTTAAPPAVACAALASLELIAHSDAARQRLQAHIRQLQAAFAGTATPDPKAVGQLLPSPTAIQPLVIGDNARTLSLSQALWAAGFWVPAIRPPTVPAGTARLRISLSAAHTEEDIAALIKTLRELS